MSDTEIQLLLEKFWNGTASACETEQLLRILNDDGTEIERHMLAEFDPSNITEPNIATKQREDLLKGIHEKISEEPGLHNVKWLNGRNILFRWAAVALIAIGCTVFWQFFDNRGSSKEMNTALVTERMDTIFNQDAVKQLVLLPDQSKVLLSPGSRITFEHGFRKRHIALTGGATFDVAHDANRIFTVSTGEVLTTDIGTVFEIDGTNREEVLVKLIEGKIKVGQIANSQLGLEDQFLHPGESIRVDISSGKMHLKKPATIKRHTNQAVSKRLVFDKTPLDVVFKEIENRFQVELVFKSDDLVNLSFSGSVELNDSLPEILDIICYMNNLTCSQKENIYTIRR